MLAPLLLFAGVATAHAQAGSPAGAVPVEHLRARRAALLNKIGAGVAILRSADQRSIEADGGHPQDSDFRQDNDFFYLTGLETQRSWLVLVARDTAPDEAILFVPPRDSIAERWTGPTLGPGPEAVALTGIEDIRSNAEAERDIRRLVLRPNSPARTHGLYIPRGERESDIALFRDLVFTPSASRAPAAIYDLRPLLAEGRLIKDADELARLRRAIAITAKAQRAAMQALKPGMWEYEIEAVIEATFRSSGAERLGFPSIIGAGTNATVLHYDKSRGQSLTGDLVVMDIGAEFGYYTADVTRTAPISGKFTARQRALYDLVLATQQAAIDSVRPGVTTRDLNRIARTYMREHSGDLCRPGTCDRFFVHGLSHWLGMDVHDVGDYSTAFAPGMVLTVEPGIYIPEERIGIRIEDDILVTADEPEILSSGAPRRPGEIEALMKGSR
ncbi:MAG: M24 family metallopeptidase [Gemmatimonadales bacterium]|nr:M24 family metallopeptidase [Gemmatimonadales bacterium]